MSEKILDQISEAYEKISKARVKLPLMIVKGSMLNEMLGETRFDEDQLYRIENNEITEQE